MNGFEVRRRLHAVDAATVRAFAALPVANISDCMARLSAGGPRLRPLHAGGVMAGVALTVKTRPGDNLMVHKALAMARPGDVIVVDGGGDLTNALIGELMLAQSARRGVAGWVIDGAVRDLVAIGASPLPVYAAGVTHRGPYKDGPGAVNVPVAVGGLWVAPGDLVIGDVDGVLSVPRAEVEAVLAAARAKQASEATTLQEIAEDRLDTGWIDATLDRLGCDPTPR